MDTDDPRIEVEDLAESQEFINSLVRQSLEWTAVAEAAEAALATATGVAANAIGRMVVSPTGEIKDLTFRDAVVGAPPDQVRTALPESSTPTAFCSPSNSLMSAPAS